MKQEISAKVILDSVACSPNGHRLTTLEVNMPRMILAEFNTHRAFSRSSASSRAVPFKKKLDQVMGDPFIPIEFGVNKPGMQASSVLQGDELEAAIRVWLDARDAAVYRAKKLYELNVHKQVVNRLLEPFMWHKAIVSATEWENFFAQRLSKHGMAQPEMGSLADEMYDAMEGAVSKSVPRILYPGDWHLPYIVDDDMKEVESYHNFEALLKISTARCARVSYENHEGKRSIEDDLSLYEKLKGFYHPAPFEHVATPGENGVGSGNFKGWKQLRSWFESNALSEVGL